MQTLRRISLSAAACLALCAQAQTVIDRGYGRRPANSGTTAAAMVAAVSAAMADTAACGALPSAPELVETADGSVYEGVICVQIPGRSITVDAESATVRVSADSLKRRIDRVYGYDELPAGWKAEMNASGDTVSDVTISSLIFPASEFHDVMVVDESESAMGFRVIEPRRWCLPWADVRKTVKRLDAAEPGILKDAITLKDGQRIEGRVSEQVRGKTMSILLDDGSTVTVPLSDVTVSETVLLPGAGIAMFPYIDTVVRNDSQDPVCGAIVRRDMGKSVTVLDAGGETTVIPLSSIERYVKEPNPSYVAPAATRMAEGEILLNGGAAYLVAPSEAGGYRILPDGIASLAVVAGEPVVVEARLGNPTAEVGITKAYRMVVADTAADIVWDYNVFTDDDFADSPVAAERTWSADGVTAIKFIPVTPGDYVVSVGGITDYLIIHVKQPQ